MTSPTTDNPTIARGTLHATSEGHVTMAVPGTSYQLLLSVYQPVAAAIGKRLVGTIKANARRIDKTDSGGRYIEPVYGRPRRIQGSVIAINPADQSLTIDAGMPITVKPTDPRQRFDQFQLGDFVATDLLNGATFTPTT